MAKNHGQMPIEDKPMTDKIAANVAEMAQKLRDAAGMSPDERLPEQNLPVRHSVFGPPEMVRAGPPAVYEAIRNVSGELAKVGVGKEGRNKEQGYNFRGIDGVQQALSPALVKHGLVVLPRMLSRVVDVRTTATGKAQFNVTVEAMFELTAVADGSMTTVMTFGEGQDMGDKATNKAMSNAYKYMAFLTFCIPTEGVIDDADATTPEDSLPVVLLTPPPVPDRYDEWLADMEATADLGIAKLQDAWNKSPHELRAHIRATDSQRWMDLKAKAAKAQAQD